jgi:hypothetical protein
MALNTCNVFFLKPQEFKPGQTYYSTGAHRSKGDYNQKVLLAFALDDDKPAWGTLRQARAAPPGAP